MRGDVDQADDVGMNAGLGDDRAAIAVADQKRRAILQVENALRRRDIVGERRLGLLHHGDVEAFLGEDLVDRLPARRVDPGAVHQHDVLQRRRTGGSCRRGETESRCGSEAGGQILHD